jgi:hypothetical protein
VRIFFSFSGSSEQKKKTFKLQYNAKLRGVGSKSLGFTDKMGLK